MLHRCNLGVLGLSFSTHSRILFSSEYFHNKIFIHKKCLEKWNDRFQENLSRLGIIDVTSRWLRNTALYNFLFCKTLIDSLDLRKTKSKIFFYEKFEISLPYSNYSHIYAPPYTLLCCLTILKPVPELRYLAVLCPVWRY